MIHVIAIRPVWDRIWARRRPVMVLVVVATLVVGVISYLLPPWYRAEVELLPPTAEDANIGLGVFLRGIGIPGVKIPTRVTASEMFVGILQSRRITEEIVQRFDLRKRYRKKYMVDAIRELGRHTEIDLSQAGSIKLAVEDKDREMAAGIANAYVELLDRYNRESRMTRGRNTRLFIGQRLEDTRRELVAAEQQLIDYQARHKTASLTPGQSAAIEDQARLFARRMALQLRMGVLRSYSEGSDEEVQIRQELAQLDHQLTALPEMGLEVARRTRDVRKLEQVLAFLTNQYEDARIREARDTRTVEFLDSASPPERKSRPKRLIMIASAFFLSLALGVGLAIRSHLEGEPPAIQAVSGA